MQEMNLGKPIYDSYINSDGELIPNGGFLNMERTLLIENNWIFNKNTGAWMPPHQ